MATTDLKLNDPGSLPRPGPVGRFVRLAFGALCLWYVIRLIPVVGNLFDSDGHIRQVVWNGIIISFFSLLLSSFSSTWHFTALTWCPDLVDHFSPYTKAN
jgi:hypothetical protein